MGDAKNFDQSVHAAFTDLYFSFMMYFDRSGSDTFEVRKRLLQWLAKNIVTRISHLFGELWAQQVGGVPSGCFNTSHMDSWIMLLWFTLFSLYQIIMAPPDIQDYLLDIFIRLVVCLVYGDDHVVNKSDDDLAKVYFAGSEFVKFMKEFFDVDVREMEDDLTFASKTRNGWYMSGLRGIIFLRHGIVLNENYKNPKYPGQPYFLPFRETWDYIVRSFKGKEAKETRTPLDLILSTLGHAYGTYASNRFAYDCLYSIYLSAIKEMGMTPEKILAKLVTQVVSENDTIRDLRRRGIDPQELLNGFPTWETLIKKNTYDEQYHCQDLDLEVIEFGEV